MAGPSNMQPAAATGSVTPGIPKKSEKTKQKQIPGLETGYYASQRSFTSEFVPLERPFGGEVPATIPLSEVIWRDYENGTHAVLNPIRIDMQSGEPGHNINYEFLNKMIVNAPRALPDAFTNAFQVLAIARIRYYATHESYRKTKTALIESVATSQLLHNKHMDIDANPGHYGPNAAENTNSTLKKCIAECNELERQFEKSSASLKFHAAAFVKAKNDAGPFMAKLKEAYRKMQEDYLKAKEAKRLQLEKAENEKRQKAKAEKEKLAKQKLTRDKVVKARRQRADAAAKAHMELNARSWAEYLATRKRLKEEANAAN
ncbi:hypothetical protein MGYG_02956 [Nannizzia gypsea CBS 118893]|uniref:Uncharacterized protein n=1 Tax=Arthroderma gypseum (strain ATCC MYA-4604 / CBS 118893) TaxID=535722 RepID=E4UQ29_ARTGP|nr:hypothetical protein MGYG_02956 [Nannizzia gypsea CBS 118893]EFQ99948.1 hypothetical protein MGYG_02956 [Nannizzia gypsea CBS 118893]